MAPQTPLPTIPIGGVVIPNTPLTKAALAYVQQHTSAMTTNHVTRSAFFALILRKKNPAFSDVDEETIVLTTLLHDMGWSITQELISKDKRFEVDGANVAREFIKANSDDSKWSDTQLQLVWDAIALHTTQTIAMYKESTVVNTMLGILADFLGPHHPSGAITVEEYKEIIKAYPRCNMINELNEIFCGLCENKPETTYDNFAAAYGIRGVEGYKEKMEQNNILTMLEQSLRKCEEFEK